MMICEEDRHCALCNDTCPSYIRVVPVAKIEKIKEAISNLIYKTFGNIYCDNCRYDDTDNFYYLCEDCHRKAMNWSVARSTCDDLAGRILCELYSEDLW